MGVCLFYSSSPQDSCCFMPHLNGQHSSNGVDSILIRQNADPSKHFVTGGYQTERASGVRMIARPSLNRAAKYARHHRSPERDDQIRLKLPSPSNRKQTGGSKQGGGRGRVRTPTVCWSTMSVWIQMCPICDQMFGHIFDTFWTFCRRTFVL